LTIFKSLACQLANRSIIMIISFESTYPFLCEFPHFVSLVMIGFPKTSQITHIDDEGQRLLLFFCSAFSLLLPEFGLGLLLVLVGCGGRLSIPDPFNLVCSTSSSVHRPLRARFLFVQDRNSPPFLGCPPGPFQVTFAPPIPVPILPVPPPLPSLGQRFLASTTEKVSPIPPKITYS